MTTLTRVITIVMLVLSILALLLSLVLFSRREEIKGRTQKLENSIIEIGKNIEAEGPSNLWERASVSVKIEPEALKNYYQVDPVTKQKVTTGTNTLDALLKDVINKSSVQLGRLNDTRDELKQTMDTLSDTRGKLTKKEEEYNTATNTIQQHVETIAGLNQTIEKKTGEISQLTEDKERLNQKVEDMNSQVAKLQDEKQDLETGLRAATTRVAKLEEELDIIKRGDKGQIVKPGLQGQVLVVNRSYNFVVIDLPPRSPLISNIDLIVQRGDRLVGKVKVREVKPKENFAVADILPAWKQPPLEVEEGDYVFR